MERAKGVFCGLAACCAIASCANGGGGDGGSESGSMGGTGSGDSGGASTGGASTGSETTGGTDGFPPPVHTPDCSGNAQGFLAGRPFTVAAPLVLSDIDGPELEELCPGFTQAALNGTLVYLPENLGSARVPLVVFSHGNGQFAGAYDYLIDKIVSDGNVVISVEAGLTADPQVRAESIGCAISWVGWDDATLGGAQYLDGNLTCDLILGGHSNGSEGSWRFLAGRNSFEFDDLFFNFVPAALFALAPKHGNGLEMAAALTVLHYMVGSAVDGQVNNEVTLRYDSSPAESELEPDARFAVQHLIHTVEHAQFGSKLPPIAGANGVPKVATENYVPAFLNWQVYDEEVYAGSITNRQLLLLEAWPVELTDPALWSGAFGYGETSAGQDCASLPETLTPAEEDAGELACDDAVGCFWDGDSCEEEACTGQPAAACTENPGCAWRDVGFGSCVDRPLVFKQFVVDAEESTTFRLAFENFENAPTLEGVSAGLTTAHGEVADLVDTLGIATGHRTSALACGLGGLRVGRGFTGRGLPHRTLRQCFPLLIRQRSARESSRIRDGAGRSSLVRGARPERDTARSAVRYQPEKRGESRAHPVRTFAPARRRVEVA